MIYFNYFKWFPHQMTGIAKDTNGAGYSFSLENDRFIIIRNNPSIEYVVENGFLSKVGGKDQIISDIPLPDKLYEEKSLFNIYELFLSLGFHSFLFIDESIFIDAITNLTNRSVNQTKGLLRLLDNDRYLLLRLENMSRSNFLSYCPSNYEACLDILRLKLGPEKMVINEKEVFNEAERLEFEAESERHKDFMIAYNHEEELVDKLVLIHEYVRTEMGKGLSIGLKTIAYFIRYFSYPKFHTSELKTLLVISKSFKTHPQIKDVRSELYKIYERRVIDNISG